MKRALDRLYRIYRGLREVSRYSALNPLDMHHFRRAAAALKRVQGNTAISYGTLRYPLPPATRSEVTTGGAAKMTYLAEAYPHAYPDCNILYMVNSVFSRPLLEVVHAAREKGIRIVVNQNGVHYPALYEFNWKKANVILAELYASADYVIYQSQFAKISAERYLGSINVPWTILHNPVDTCHFNPKPKTPIASGPLLMSIASRTNRFYRIEMSLATLANLRKSMPRARLIIPGYNPDRFGDRQAIRMIYRYAREKKIPADAIELLPSFTKQEAPDVLNRGHILLHISHNDPSPSFVVEAMACGLPIVYLANGGTPELVSDSAGIGIPSETNYEKAVLPDPVCIAEAVARIVEKWEDYSAEAHRHACDRFNLANFLSRHRAIFSQLCESRDPDC